MIRSTERGRRTVLIGLFLLFAAPLAFGQPGRGPAPVYVANVVELTRASTVDLIGDVQPIRRSIVACEEPGLVNEFPRREGEFVAEGEPLCTLDSSYAKLELGFHEAMLAAAKAELSELENGTRAEIVAASRARLESARAMLDLARLRFDRLETLQRQRAVSPEDFDAGRANLRAAEQDVLRFEAELEENVNGPRTEQIARKKAEVEAAAAEVDKLKVRLSKREVRAPYDGYIVEEHAQVGEWIELGGPVVTMVDLEAVDIRALAPSRYAGRVPIGMEARVQVDSATDRLLIGRIDRVTPDVDTKARLFPILIRLDNRFDEGRPILKAGMLARVSLPIGEEQPGLYVPKDALVLSQESTVVYVLRESESVTTAHPVPVILGATLEDRIKVEGRLSAGERVVTRGNERLKPGMQVVVQGTTDPKPPADVDSN